MSSELQARLVDPFELSFRSEEDAAAVLMQLEGKSVKAPLGTHKSNCPNVVFSSTANFNFKS
jgi:hypothetical protein